MNTAKQVNKQVNTNSLSNISMAIGMAQCHHEGPDGKGYPNSLKGNNIMLCAKIMAVADVFDALVSVRSYKKAYSFKEAMQLLRNGAGSRFAKIQ